MVQVKAEIYNGKIYVVPEPRVRFPGDIEMSKDVQNGRWDKENRAWYYPLTLVTCRALRAVYTDMLVIGPDLARWSRAEIANSEEMGKLSHAMDAPLTRVPAVAPRVDAAMAQRTYQRVAARFIADQGNVLIADEPGLGKSIEFFGGLVEAGKEVGLHLIIAPRSSLFSTWAREVFKWTDFHPFWMPEGRERRERMWELFYEDEHPSKFLIINTEMVQTLYAHWCQDCEKWEPTKAEAKRCKDEDREWWDMRHYIDNHKTVRKIKKQDWPDLFEIEWTSICVDEAHLSLLGNRGKNKTQTAEGMGLLKTAPGGIRVAMTGTPLKGKAMNFWATFNWLRPDVYTSRWAFAKSFLDVKNNGFGQVIGDVRADREAALYESLRPIMLRRFKREVQPDLPEDVYEDHWVELDGLHLKQYKEFELAGEVEIEGGSLSAQGILAEYTRRKQFAFGKWKNVDGVLTPDKNHSPKYEKLLGLLAERGVTGNKETEFRLEGGAHKYIIGGQFTRILDFLYDALDEDGIACEMITGNVSGPMRDKVVNTWQNNPDGPRVLLINTWAGGTSLTLDAMCDEMFILDETWTRDDQFQLEGRIRNREVEKRVAVRFFHYIRTAGTIEEEIAESGLSQDEFQKTILDRSRGHVIEKRSIKK
jgi:SNF2 family DNA or RNA helicase